MGKYFTAVCPKERKTGCITFHFQLLLYNKMDDTKTICQYFKEKTRKIHDESDRLVNLKLVVVLTDPVLYGKAINEFYYVYMTLESALEQCRDHPLIAPVLMRDLFRAAAFEKDLAFYLGNQWKNFSPSSPTSAYCDRILAVCNDNPILLIAYVANMELHCVWCSYVTSVY